MKIAIMGTGGVGGYFGGRLAEGGLDVTFIARGAHLEAIRANGLSVESPLGDFRIRPAKATDDPASVGPVDIVLVTVKLWDTEAAARAIKPMIGPETAAISLQNGVEKEDILTSVLGREAVMGGVSQIGAVIAGPGAIRHNGRMARIIFGELDGRRSRRAEAFEAACKAAAIDVELTAEIEQAIWQKFIFLSAMSGMTALTRLPIGPIRADADTRALLIAAMSEAAALARAQGVRLAEDMVERTLAFMDNLPPEMKSSMLQDLERGNRLELPWLSGAVVRLGRERGVDVPVSAFITTALKLHAGGARSGG